MKTNLLYKDQWFRDALYLSQVHKHNSDGHINPPPEDFIYDGGMLPEVLIKEEPMPWYEKAGRKLERGWENLKNTPTMTTIPGGHPYMASQTFPTVPSTVGQDLSVAKAAALPYFMGATPVQAFMAGESGYNLASENGVRKTKQAFDEERYGDMAWSGKSVVNDVSKKLKITKNLKPLMSSELDWSPESWLGKRHGGRYTQEDVAALQSHIPEYLEIERTAKANDTWLKMPDGTTWQGDPRSWVQLMSKDGQKLVPKRHFTGVPYNKVDNFPNYLDEIWASDSELMAQDWSRGLFGNSNGTCFEVTYPKNVKLVTHDGQMNSYSKLPPVYSKKQEPLTHIDDIANHYRRDGYDVLNVDNVLEGNGFIVNDTYIAPNVPRKSLVGGNGNFDLNDRNIYKGFLPFTFLTGIAGSTQNE